MGYKVSVDLDLCQGYVNCVIECPEVFDIDEETNKVILLNDDPGEALRAKTEAAARGCPTNAIRIEDT